MLNSATRTPRSAAQSNEEACARTGNTGRCSAERAGRRSARWGRCPLRRPRCPSAAPSAPATAVRWPLAGQDRRDRRQAGARSGSSWCRSGPSAAAGLPRPRGSRRAVGVGRQPRARRTREQPRGWMSGMVQVEPGVRDQHRHVGERPPGPVERVGHPEDAKRLLRGGLGVGGRRCGRPGAHAALVQSAATTATRTRRGHEAPDATDSGRACPVRAA